LRPFERTLNFTIGRLAVEETRELLRRRRRSRRASAEKKWRPAQAVASAALTPRIASIVELLTFIADCLAHSAGM
jgi:hypothetical protein